MTGEDQGSQADGLLLESVDAKLTMFALANGLDLKKEPGLRRLEWYAEGLERGVEIAPNPDGALTLVACAWSFGRRESTTRSPLAGSVAPDELMGRLASSIEAANGL